MHDSKISHRRNLLRQRYLQLFSAILTLAIFKFLFTIPLNVPPAHHSPFLQPNHPVSNPVPDSLPGRHTDISTLLRSPSKRGKNRRRRHNQKRRRRRPRPSPRPRLTWKERMLSKLPPDLPGCLPYILFDKPVKTGSTAITRSLFRYFMGHSATAAVCSMESCTQVAADICADRRPRTHIISHIRSNASLVECLRKKGYYVVTSVREPLERWSSSYRYNRMMNASHYGINSTEGYSSFMNKMPDCSLFDYYDGLGEHCKDGVSGEEVRKRARDIVGRFDEVIDLYGENDGELYGRVKEWLGMKNVSPPSDTEGDFEAGRMDREKVLYEEILERKRQLPDSSRVLCHRIGT